MNKFCILNYHGLESFESQYPCEDKDRDYVLSLSTFERQLDGMIESRPPILNTSVILRSEATKDLKSGDPSLRPPKNMGDSAQDDGFFRGLILTFDDGLISHYELAMPALKRRNLKAIFFVIAGWVGTKGYMNWTQLQEMIAEGFEIGSHGLSHRALTNLKQEALEREIKGSKDLLEEKLGIPIKSFSVPKGFYDASISETAKKAGYQFVFTSDYGWNDADQSPWKLKRIAVKASDPEALFSQILENRLGFKAVKEQFKEIMRSHLPPSFYDGLAFLKRGIA